MLSVKSTYCNRLKATEQVLHWNFCCLQLVVSGFNHLCTSTSWWWSLWQPLLIFYIIFGLFVRKQKWVNFLISVLFIHSCDCDGKKKHSRRLFVVFNNLSNKSFGLVMVTRTESETLSWCTGTEVISTISALCHVWLSPPGLGPLVRMDVPSMAFRAWFRCWRLSASWLQSPGTDITSTAPVSTTLAPGCSKRYHSAQQLLASPPARSKSNSQWWLKAMHTLLIDYGCYCNQWICQKMLNYPFKWVPQQVGFGIWCDWVIRTAEVEGYIRFTVPVMWWDQWELSDL